MHVHTLTKPAHTIMQTQLTHMSAHSDTHTHTHTHTSSRGYGGLKHLFLAPYARTHTHNTVSTVHVLDLAVARRPINARFPFRRAAVAQLRMLPAQKKRASAGESCVCMQKTMQLNA